jgi:AcrR family transcriptional regulator
MSDNVEATAGRNVTDRRVQKTRAALMSAFNALLLTRGVDAFSAADVAGHANVGRSTFYDHFDGKDDILAQSQVSVLTPLADSCVEPEFSDALRNLLEHFWQNRQVARSLMSGRRYLHVSKQLSELIAERLDGGGGPPRRLCRDGCAKTACQQLCCGQDPARRIEG